jgi:ATP-binding cassette subfamily B (MDR/TAP) protein 1
MLVTLLNFKDHPAQSRKDANLYALVIFLLAVFAFFIVISQNVLFSLIGEHITKKIRLEVYNKILRMPVSWFDNPKNNAGSLTAKLSSDCNNVNGLATSFIAIMIMNVASLIDGITIAFIFEWRTALVALGLIPFIILGGVVQMAFNTGFS